MRWVTVAGILICIGACAPRPSEIGTTPYIGNDYAGLSCAELAEVKERTTAEKHQMELQQAETASNDAVGVLIIGVPLGSLENGDQAVKIAEIKGRVDAISKAERDNNC